MTWGRPRVGQGHQGTVCHTRRLRQAFRCEGYGVNFARLFSSNDLSTPFPRKACKSRQASVRLLLFRQTALGTVKWNSHGASSLTRYGHLPGVSRYICPRPAAEGLFGFLNRGTSELAPSRLRPLTDATCGFEAPARFLLRSLLSKDKT